MATIEMVGDHGYGPFEKVLIATPPKFSMPFTQVFHSLSYFCHMKTNIFSNTNSEHEIPPTHPIA
jgi:hypothetical protein